MKFGYLDGKPDYTSKAGDSSEGPAVQSLE